MNNITKERLAAKLLQAQMEQGLMNKKTAEYLGLSPSDISFIKRSHTYDNISERKWTVIHEWNNSGLTLEEFYKTRIKPSEPKPVEESSEEIEFPEIKSIPSPGELKLRIKEAVRKVREKEANKESQEAGRAMISKTIPLVKDKKKPISKPPAKKSRKNIDSRTMGVSTEEINNILSGLSLEIDVLVTIKDS